MVVILYLRLAVYNTHGTYPNLAPYLHTLHCRRHINKPEPVAHCCYPRLSQQPVNLTRVEPDQNTQYQEHGNRIEDINESFVGDHVSLLSLDVFDEPHNGANKNQGAGRVQREEVLAPWDHRRFGAYGRVSVDATLEDDGDHEEEAEEDDLNEKSADDDILACIIGRGFGLDHDSGACKDQYSPLADDCRELTDRTTA